MHDAKHDTFPPPAAEHWLARKLNAPALLSGATTDTQRRERLRSLILERELADEHCGTRLGKSESFAQVFERLYKQPLHPTSAHFDGESDER